MQSARIWFRQPSPARTLDDAMQELAAKGARIERVEWTSGAFSVPQLRVVHPVPFLVQLNEDEYVIEEAEEFSDLEGVPAEMRATLAACDARLECGDVAENRVETGQGMIVFEGWTRFDPAQPMAHDILIGLATAFDGILEDNVNGAWWTPDMP